MLDLGIGSEGLGGEMMTKFPSTLIAATCGTNEENGHTDPPKKK
jgi:hypothetical protein